MCSFNDVSADKAYADLIVLETYLIIPASNEHSLLAELASIQNWSLRNNLKLNSNKSREIIFADNRRRQRDTIVPEPLPGILGNHSLKILPMTLLSLNVPSN